MAYKTYSREEYLEWCKNNGVKRPLDEIERNKFTESGYPTRSANINYAKEVDADDWYKSHW